MKRDCELPPCDSIDVAIRNRMERIRESLRKELRHTLLSLKKGIQMEQLNLEKVNDFSPNKDEVELLDPVTGEPILPPKDEPKNLNIPSMEEDAEEQTIPEKKPTIQ